MPETDARENQELPRLDDHDVWSRVEALPGPALILVSSVFCGGCRILRRRLLAAIEADIGVESGTGLAGRLFELDAGDSPGFVQAAEVFHLPALVWIAPGEEPKDVTKELSGDSRSGATPGSSLAGTLRRLLESTP